MANDFASQGGPSSQPNPGPSHSTARTAAPSIHVLALLTWLAIFPLVAIGITAMAPFTVSWDPLLRVFVLTTVVVPLSVYLVVPWFVRIYHRYLGAPIDANRKDHSRCR